MKNTRHLLPGLAAALLAGTPLVTAQDNAPRPDGWSHSGVVTLLTTPDGASLPAEAVVEGFPVLVRLDKESAWRQTKLVTLQDCHLVPKRTPIRQNLSSSPGLQKISD